MEEKNTVNAQSGEVENSKSEQNNEFTIENGVLKFKGCRKLPFLDIPQSVCRIGRGACDFTLLVIH